MDTIKERSRATFNRQAATYDRDIKGQHARSLYPILLEKLSHISFQSALDLGCGTGEMMKRILQADASKDLCGIDFIRGNARSRPVKAPGAGPSAFGRQRSASLPRRFLRCCILQ